MRVWEWKRVLVGSSVLVACKQNFEIGTVGEGEIFGANQARALFTCMRAKNGKVCSAAGNYSWQRERERKGCSRSKRYKTAQW